MPESCDHSLCISNRRYITIVLRGRKDMKKNGIIRSIDHMVITTADLEACLNFYEGLLGMEHRVEGGQHALHFGDQKINLHTRPHEFHPSATNVTHGSQDFCLISDGDIHASG